MIESLISHFSKHFEMTQELIDTEEEGWYLRSVCSVKGKIVYEHHLLLEPLYNSMKQRLKEEEQ